MKKLLLIIILLLSLTVAPTVAFAQGMMGGRVSSPSGTGSDNHTAQEEAEGKEIWEGLQSKQLECQGLTDEDFQALGEYFMGQFIGNTERHVVMNQMMTNMMGENGEEQMHVTLGKRSSGCDTNAAFPSGYGFMPMMGMMGFALAPWSFGGTEGGGNPMMGYGGWTDMMGGWGGFGLSWVLMILFWVLAISGIVALVRWMISGGKANSSKTPLDILKERYARGEIDKDEFEQRKRDLS